MKAFGEHFIYHYSQSMHGELQPPAGRTSCYFFFDPVPLTLIRKCFSPSSPIHPNVGLWEHKVAVSELPFDIGFEVLETDHLLPYEIIGQGRTALSGVCRQFKNVTSGAYRALTLRNDFAKWRKGYYAPFIPHLRLTVSRGGIPVKAHAFSEDIMREHTALAA